MCPGWQEQSHRSRLRKRRHPCRNSAAAMQELGKSEGASVVGDRDCVTCGAGGLSQERIAEHGELIWCWNLAMILLALRGLSMFPPHNELDSCFSSGVVHVSTGLA